MSDYRGVNSITSCMKNGPDTGNARSEEASTQMC